MRYEIRALGPWVGRVTADRSSASRFRAAWDDTLKLLAFEADMLGATYLILQVDADPSDIRRDGMLRARARVGFPGVKVSIGSVYGPLEYATDAYEDWRANIRAIALSLVALRAVDRHGVSKRGEQYRGWTALEGGADATKRAAQDLIAGYGGLAEALKTTHPDHGGSAEAFQRVMEARRALSL
jgi:hypothetical protein